MKPCKCGCGELIQERNRNGPLYYKRQHGKTGRKFPNENKHQLGNLNNNWRGGRIETPYGYVHIRSEGHPRASHAGQYVPEHVLIMEKSIGRYLQANEVVHHINGIKNDNRLENLIVLTNGQHSSYHRKKEFSEGKKFGKHIKRYESYTGNKAQLIS